MYRIDERWVSTNQHGIEVISIKCHEYIKVTAKLKAFYLMAHHQQGAYEYDKPLVRRVHYSS